jgi:hypothetical protein
MHKIIDKKFYLGPKFGTLFNKKWITISELLQPVKMSYLHEAMRLVGMWHTKMRQHRPVVLSDIWRCRCVQVLISEALQLKSVTIKGSSELYHKGRRRVRRQGGKVAINVSRPGDQAQRVVGR